MTAWDDIRALFPENTDGSIGADDMRAQVDDLETLDALNAKLASPTLTGVPAAPTAAPATTTTQIATTSFATTADDLKADLASPTLTGVPAAPTAAPATSTTQIATTAFATTADNLKADASAISNIDNTSDASKPVSTDTQTALDLKANIASPTFTGAVVLPTTNIGDGGANYSEFEADGTLVLHGTATTWEDIQSPIDAAKVSGGGTVLVFDYDENILNFKVGGDIADEDKRIMISVQYPHKAIVDGTLHLHIHWEQNASDATPIIWTSQYRIQNNGSLHQSSWSTPVAASSTLASGNNAFAYTSGTLNQITELQAIDMTGASISAVVQVRVARTDVVSGDIGATMIDFHYEADTLGSNTEYVK